MRGLYRVAEAGRPACMTETEYALWREANAWHPAVSVKSPCSDCPAAFAEAMLAIQRCNGIPKDGATGRHREDLLLVFLPQQGLRYATEDERRAARRASWRQSSARRRAAMVTA